MAGADGGGTRLRLLLMDGEGRIMGRRSGPPALLIREGGAQVARLLASELRALAREVGSALPLAGFCVGLAGAGRRAWAVEVEAQLRAQGVARRVEVVTDAAAALDDAFPVGRTTSPGILLVAGTGSIGLARTSDGEMRRVGGWGPLLGDEGSGYRLGLEGLRAAVRALEGRGPGTRLESILLEEVGAGDPEGVFRWLDQAEKGRVAALAPLVIAAAGDPVADRLVTEAVDALASHLTALLEVMDAPPAGMALPVALPVALHGGLLAPGGPLRPPLVSVLERLGLDLHPEDVDAARGAAHRILALLTDQGR